MNNLQRMILSSFRYCLIELTPEERISIFYEILEDYCQYCGREYQNAVDQCRCMTTKIKQKGVL